MAAEQIGKIDVPKRAQYLRVLAAELQRVASHLLWLGTWCMDMGGALGGGATIFLYCIRERELILDLFESLVGARLLYGFHQVGGVRYDMPAGWAAQCRETVDRDRAAHRRVRADARGQPVLPGAHAGRRRHLARAGARTSASRGPLLRGSGVDFDLRRADAVLVVRGLRVHACRSRPPATASRATACGWSSSASRSRSSGRCSTACPRARSRRGPALKSVAQMRIPKGEAYARVEGPRGEVGCYLIADGSAKPYRMKWRGASFSNLAVLPHIIPGHKVADVVAIMGSVDPVFGEVDR